jgi:hypothetical protein
MKFFKTDLSDSRFESAESAISNYRDDFKIRSGGFSLPTVHVTEIYRANQSLDISQPQLLISLPVCNQESIIHGILTQLITHISISSTLVIIIDYCLDNSEAVIRQVIENFDEESCISEILLLKSQGDLFESTCENLTLAVADADYFLSMQADIYFVDPKFLYVAVAGFVQHSTLLAIGSRAVIPIEKPSRFNVSYILYKAVTKGLNWLTSELLGVVFLFPRLFMNSYHGDISSPPKNKLRFSRIQSRRIYPGAYLIRGPILWRTNFLRELGGNDDVSFFMGGDERKLCLRGAAERGFFVGYLPSFCFTNLWTGTSHKAHLRSNETALAFEERAILCDKHRVLEESGLLEKASSLLKKLPNHITVGI